MSIFLALLRALPLVLAVVREIIAYVKAAEQRQIGRQEAVNEALVIQADQLRIAREARFEAEQKHAKDQTDDAFDQDFKRADP